MIPQSVATEAFAYHRLFRSVPRYAWWRPLAASGIFLGIFLTIQVVIGVLLAMFLILGQISRGKSFSPADALDLVDQLTDVSNPLVLIFLLGSVALMLPLVPLAMLCVGLRPVGIMHSVVFKLRLRWMLWCAVPSLVVTAVSVGLSFLPLLFGETLEPVSVDPVSLLLSVLVIILLVPVQAAAEEYVFRGMILQTLGAWVRSPWLGVLVSTVIFTLGHTQYEIWGLLSVAVMGLSFAVVALRTGGLEAGIAFHTVNNVLALILLATGLTGTTQMGSEGAGPLDVLFQLVFAGIYVLWVEWGARRHRIARVLVTPLVTSSPTPRLATEGQF